MVERLRSLGQISAQSVTDLTKCFNDFFRRGGGELTSDHLWSWLYRTATQGLLPENVLFLVGRDDAEGGIRWFAFAVAMTEGWNPAEGIVRITAMYVEPGARLRTGFLKWIEAWARSQNAGTIVFQTARESNAMERHSRSGGHGYEPQFTVFAKQVTYDE